jgi:hypothetical protein
MRPWDWALAGLPAALIVALALWRT